MSLRPMVVLPDSRLFLCSEEVRSDELDEMRSSLIPDMFETMYDENGVGLAAVQVGIHKRLFIMDVSDGEVISRYMRNMTVDEQDKPSEEESEDDSHIYHSTCGPTVVINPRITELSNDTVTMNEGCLSVPGQRELVTRPSRVVVQYIDEHGKSLTLRAQGLLARCLQHEIDHLNGVVFIKHLSKLKRDLVMEKAKKIASSNG